MQIKIPTTGKKEDEIKLLSKDPLAFTIPYSLLKKESKLSVEHYAKKFVKPYLAQLDQDHLLKKRGVD